VADLFERLGFERMEDGRFARALPAPEWPDIETAIAGE
jgi:hypothetical protein